MTLAAGGFTNATFFPIEEGSPGYVIPCRVLDTYWTNVGLMADAVIDDDDNNIISAIRGSTTVSMSIEYFNEDLMRLIFGLPTRASLSKMHADYRRKTRWRNRRR